MSLPSLASPDKETIRTFFDGIASCYDRVNSILSLRVDELWRKWAAEIILSRRPTFCHPTLSKNGRVAESRTPTGDTGERLLDLGVGTGKFLQEFLKKKHWQFCAGADFSGEMLQAAKNKLPDQCALIQADIHELPFENESFDLVVSSFTLRSVKDRRHFFDEITRVLKPEGRVAFLCLTRPNSRIGEALYRPYLKFYLPVMGGWISKDRKAYQFLSQSIQSFPSPEEIAGELEAAGFKEVSITRFTFGLSTLIQASSGPAASQ